MSLRFSCAAALAAASTLLTATPANACGGCFVDAAESTVVTGHRMALSVSPTQAVLWDQIQYSGDPAEFSWVLPVKRGARIEIANDAFFEALDAATTLTVGPPPEGCGFEGDDSSGFGCGAMSADEVSLRSAGGYYENGVEIVHQGTIGPYETVTLAAEEPAALRNWLAAHGYVLPDAVAPTVDAYVNEGFDFIALRLQPDQGVQAMKPVRVVSPGGAYSLPLRMVAAGVGASVNIVLFVLGEGRYEAGNFEMSAVPPSLVTWDFRTDESDYASLRLAALGNNEGRTWLTSYAKNGAILSSVEDPLSMSTLTYAVGTPDPARSAQIDTIAEAYFRQGEINGELTGASSSVDGCAAVAEQHASSSDVVADLCDDMGSCVPPNSTQIDARDLACGSLDDLAVAFDGLHPQDVFLTRLEANLPIAALDVDLTAQASEDQAEVESRFVAGLSVNNCWDAQESLSVPLAPRSDRRPPVSPDDMIVLFFGTAALYLVSRRGRSSAPVPA